MVAFISLMDSMLWLPRVMSAVRRLVEWPMRALWDMLRRLLWPSLSALHWATYDGADDTSKLVALARSNPRLLESRDSDGRTPLFYAANDHIVSALVDDLHCELYTTDARGETALTTFAGAHRLDLVTQLLLCGYDPNIELPLPKGSEPDQARFGLPVCRAVWELDEDLLRSLIVFGAHLMDLPAGVNLKHICLQRPTTISYGRSSTPSAIFNMILALINWYPNQRWRQAQKNLILSILDEFGVPNCSCPECSQFALEQGTCKEMASEEALFEFLERLGVKDAARRAAFCRLLLEEEQCQKLANLKRVPRTGPDRLAWLEGVLDKTDSALQSAPPVPDLKNAIHILSLDGGGVKGLVPLHYLIHLQRMFKQFSNDDMISKFNFLAGTSTGSIIACGILKGISLAELRKIYFNLLTRIFSDESDPTENIEATLKQMLGASVTVEQLRPPPYFICTTTRVDIEPEQLKLIRYQASIALASTCIVELRLPSYGRV